VETVEPDYTGLPAAVGFNETGGTVAIENLHIGSFTAIDCPLYGLRLGDGGGVFRNVSVASPKLVNCGSTFSTTLPYFGFRSAVRLFPNKFDGYLSSENIQIVDNLATPKLMRALQINAAASTTCPTDIKFSLAITGTPDANFRHFETFAETDLIARVQGRSNVTFVSVSGDDFAKGSNVTNTTTELVYRLDAAGDDWTQHYSGTGAPSGAVEVFSTYERIDAGAGDPYLYRYTASGWKVYATVAA